MPLVVRVVLARIGDLGEREEPELDLVHRRHRTVVAHGDRHARRRAQPAFVVAHLDVPDPAHAAAVDRDADAVHRSLADRPQEARVVRHAERDPAFRRARRAPCPSTRASPRSRRTHRRGRCPSAGTRRAAPADARRTGRSRRTRRRRNRSSRRTRLRPATRELVRRRRSVTDAEASVSAMGAGTWESHHAITTLMFRYAEYVDAADFDAIADLFADAVITNEGVDGEIAGGEAIKQLYVEHQPRARRRNAAHPSPHRERRGRHRGGGRHRDRPLRVRRVPTDADAAAAADRDRPLPRPVRARRTGAGASRNGTSSSTTSATSASTSRSISPRSRSNAGK